MTFKLPFRFHLLLLLVLAGGTAGGPVVSVSAHEGVDKDWNTETNHLAVAVPSHADEDHRTSRIINGKTAARGDHPYLCSLQKLYRWYNAGKGVWRHLCGSVIYNTVTLITAAHCVKDSRHKLNELQVVCGEYSLQHDDGTEVYKRIASVRIHEDYDSEMGYYPNDIAMLYLEDALEFNPYVHAGKIDDGTKPVPTNCQLMGWGITEERELPDTPRDVNIIKLSNQECRHVLPVGEGHVCFKTFGSVKASCDGDSGSPAACGDVIVGVSSWGMDIPNCITPTFPSVYTRLSAYIDWIRRYAH